MTHPHPSAEELLAHARRTGSPADTVEVSAHLVACAACRAAYGELVPASAGAWDALPPGPAPGVDYETLGLYLDGALDPVDREILEADLRNHPSLAAQLADLRRLRAEEDAVPGSAPANVIALPTATRRHFPAWAAVAAGLMLVGIAWYLVASRSAATLRDDGREADVRLLTEAADIPADLRTATRAAAAAGAMPLPEDWKTLRGEPGTLLAETPSAHPDGASFSLLAPVGVVVRGLRPVFRWTPRAGASAYRVTLLELPDGEARSSPFLSATDDAWTPDRPLAAGQRYAWQVQALGPEGNVLAKTPSPPQPEARFQTLAAAQESQLQQLETAHPHAHLLLAVAAARCGLLAEAEGHLQALAAANPGKALPDSLLRQVRALRGAGQPSARVAPTVTNGAQ